MDDAALIDPELARRINTELGVAEDAIRRARKLMTQAGIKACDMNRRMLGDWAEGLRNLDARTLTETDA